MNYPKAIKGNQTDTYFGKAVSDPYRDLENDSDATKKWVDEEVAYSQNYLSKIPFRDKIKSQLKDIWNYEKFQLLLREATILTIQKTTACRHSLFFTEQTRRRKLQKYF